MKYSMDLLIFAACLSPLYAQSQVQQDWANHYASGLAPGDDGMTDIVVDPASGNIYVTGYMANNTLGQDYFTAKYDASGAQLWAARYNGPVNGNDRASAICLDIAGNVYVTGRSLGLDGTLDYATIKYNSVGVQQWAVRFEGANNSNDEAHQLAIDNLGNVFVAGISGPRLSEEYLTLKYNQVGIKQWLAHYNGLSYGSRNIAGIGIDDLGNVYIAGSFGTIKYDNFGVQQWVANNLDPFLFRPYFANAIALDDSANVYVAGSGFLNASVWNYITIKYNGHGKRLWTATYQLAGKMLLDEQARALTIDDSGYVYVTGTGGGMNNNNYDYVTIKYNYAGVQQWTALYNGPENKSDDATALAVDKFGNVHVTGNNGFDFATVKYNRNGVQQWAAQYNGPRNGVDQVASLAIDKTGNVYAGGKTYGGLVVPFVVAGIIDTYDFSLVKYNREGIKEWEKIENGSASFELPASLAVDGAGNTYVTGTSCGLNVDRDFATIKYDKDGIQNFATRYHGAIPGSPSFDQAKTLNLDLFGNVYVTGLSNSGTTDDYTTVKYNPNGTQEWVARCNFQGHQINEPTASFIDAAGNIYVTGYSVNLASGTGSDFATVKYNLNGVQQWIARYGDTQKPNNLARAIIVDGKGNVYVTGLSRTNTGENEDYVTVKYNSNGIRQWAVRYNGPGNWHDRPAAIAVDRSGNVYVTGFSSTTSAFDYVTIKYNSNGVQQWLANYTELKPNSDDRATALLVDQAGNVYVTGASDRDNVTIKYNSNGIAEWVARYNSIYEGLYGNFAFALDSSGNVYVAGTTIKENISTSTTDIVIIKYNTTGVKQWVARYNGPGWSDDYAKGIALDRFANVYLLGWSIGDGWKTYTTVKYVQSTVDVSAQKPNQPYAYSLLKNYPNPFNPSTTIRYAIARPGHVTLKVFNLRGQEIATLVNENKFAREYEIQWNPTEAPSGVYVYRLQAGDFVQTRKLILLR
jgi:uncharacterized delta-60 repeat protein